MASSTTQQKVAANPALRVNALNLFAQDDFKATSKLTLNYGMRWEYLPKTWDKDELERMDCVGAISVTLLNDLYIRKGSYEWLRRRQPFVAGDELEDRGEETGRRGGLPHFAGLQDADHRRHDGDRVGLACDLAPLDRERYAVEHTSVPCIHLGGT